MRATITTNRTHRGSSQSAIAARGIDWACERTACPPRLAPHTDYNNYVQLWCARLVDVAHAGAKTTRRQHCGRVTMQIMRLAVEYFQVDGRTIKEPHYVGNNSEQQTANSKPHTQMGLEYSFETLALRCICATTLLVRALDQDCVPQTGDSSDTLHETLGNLHAHCCENPHTDVHIEHDTRALASFSI